MTLPTMPFGDDITTEDILDTLSFFESWEERYKYIIDLGKSLPPMENALKTDERIVRGCQSQVWVASELRDGKLFFAVDSDAFIVKGLLALVMAAYNNKTPAQVIDFDIESYFEALALIKHLSPTRGNGIKAMVHTVQELAKAI
ncbi:SufE family protein [Agaribacterium haliotis]|uniref:SufE family protein n=1 Tax=Agaribacterium haliotis TaxID=2013869 RepID=UPI000BB57A13|nr:SufE family protein [Agaribacterium haliotis]